MSKIWSFSKFILKVFYKLIIGIGWCIEWPLRFMRWAFYSIWDISETVWYNIEPILGGILGAILTVFAGVIIGALVLIGRLYVDRAPGHDPRIDRTDWLELFAVLPMYVNRQFIWLKPFWVAVAETPTGKKVLQGQVHPQQLPVYYDRYRVHLVFHSQRDRVIAKLKGQI